MFVPGEVPRPSIDETRARDNKRVYLMVVRPVLLPYRYGLNNQLLKYLPYRFCRQFGMYQVVPIARMLAISHEDAELCGHTDKNGGNSLVQVAKA